jgi:hypothetical protein
MDMSTTNKKTATKSTRPMRSFILEKDTPPFFAFRITHQTFYWTILSLLILALGIWVVTLSVRVQQLYDQVQTSAIESQNETATPKKNN